VSEAYKDAGITAKDIQAAWVGTLFSGNGGRALSEPLKLEHDLFSLELEVLEFSNTGKFITILFSRKFALAEPENVCYFKLHFGGRTYPVEHMGINFEIPTLGVKGVTFVVSDDKARQT
jgi:hypothetical protein